MAGERDGEGAKAAGSALGVGVFTVGRKPWCLSTRGPYRVNHAEQGRAGLADHVPYDRQGAGVGLHQLSELHSHMEEQSGGK